MSSPFARIDRKVLLLLAVVSIALYCSVYVSRPRSEDFPDLLQGKLLKATNTSRIIHALEEIIKTTGWQFNTTRDERNYGMTDEQCDIAFPGLWQDIERVTSQSRRKGNITFHDLEKSAEGSEVVRVLIYDRQVSCAQWLLRIRRHLIDLRYT